MELKENLKKLRISRGFTQSDVAEKLGFKSHNAYNLWENGKTSPSVRDLERIASVFGVSVIELLFDTIQQKPVQADREIFQEVEFLRRENFILKSFLKEKGVDLGKYKGVVNSPKLYDVFGDFSALLHRNNAAVCLPIYAN